MNIRSIELKNFRNYENLEISFDEGTNILFGDNAQGKTNILEAAYMSGTTKSHKGSRDREMISFKNGCRARRQRISDRYASEEEPRQGDCHR